MGRKTKDWKFRITFLAALAVFIFAAAKLGLSFWEYHKGAQQYQELEGIAGLPSTKKSDDKGNKSQEPAEQMVFEKRINAVVYLWRLGIMEILEIRILLSMGIICGMVLCLPS